MPAPPKGIRDFWWLLRAQLLVLRDQWYWYLVQASFVPLSLLLFLWLLVGRQDPTEMPFFVVGSLISGLSFAGMLSLGQELGGMKDQHAFEHYAALPISKIAFVAALATRGTLLSLPAATVVLLVGHLAFDVTTTPMVIVILILSAYALAGLGAVIGFWSPTSQISSLATQILQTVIVNFGPVYITLSSLPRPLQWIAHIWPTTYSAEALRSAVNHNSITDYITPLAVLVGFVIISLVLVPMRLSWRDH
jgi:ABC-2 type transport system permease protein